MKYIDGKFLKTHRNYIFVFGDNLKRRGYKGGARLRDYENAYGFITKKYPSNNDNAFYKPEEYKLKFESELKTLIKTINQNKDKTFLMTEIGSRLANRYRIYQRVIKPGLQVLRKYKNVMFLDEQERTVEV